MRIRVLGCGFYGAHLACALKERGHEIEVHEIAPEIFTGASGSCPARIHNGQHYPRSHATRKHCREHYPAFMERYGHLTSGVPVNVYAVAAHDSLVDFGNYVQTLGQEIEFVTVHDPGEYGLQNVEGAILTGERHIVVRKAREHFKRALKGHIKLNTPPDKVDSPEWDWTIDCTFCANEAANIDRYEPCLTVILEGPTDRAVTIMDGPFPSLYPWDEEQGLSSLTSAKFTPFCKVEKWEQARSILDDLDESYIRERAEEMFDQLAHFWPEAKAKYKIADYRLAIRAMPRSGADARLVDVVKVGERALRVRAGKIDAVMHAERLISDAIEAA